MNEDKTFCPNILILEDNEDDILVTKRAFEKDPVFNGTLFIVENGIEALDFLYNRNKYSDPKQFPKPDLILVDINMPMMNGIEFLKTIKEVPEFKTIPSIILSSSQNNQDIQKCYSLGASGYIVKPVSFLRFKEVIHQFNEYWQNNEIIKKG
jgi:two-component system, response regulator